MVSGAIGAAAVFDFAAGFVDTFAGVVAASLAAGLAAGFARVGFAAVFVGCLAALAVLADPAVRDAAGRALTAAVLVAVFAFPRLAGRRFLTEDFPKLTSG